MKAWQQVWTETDGVLSFEWTLLITLVCIGIVSGVTGARDAVIDELGDAAQAMLALDQSFTIDSPLAITVDGIGGGALDSFFDDSATYTDCARTSAPTGQGGLSE